MDGSEVKTFHSTIATIKFSSGVDFNDSGSESGPESGPDDINPTEQNDNRVQDSRQQENVDNINSTNNNIKVDQNVQNGATNITDSEESLAQDTITIIDPGQVEDNNENTNSVLSPQALSTPNRNLVQPERFNPFDKEKYDPNEKLFPQAEEASPSGILLMLQFLSIYYFLTFI